MNMSDKMGAAVRSLAVLITGLLLGGVQLCDAALEARAAENAAFTISAEMLASGNATYDIQVSVGNMGEDWEGTVRLLTEEDYRMGTAYDTALSLPQGSTKQFAVKVPKSSVESGDGTVRVFLLDKKSRKVADKEFRKLLRAETNVLSMGILSDNYSDLTFLDMGGENLNYYGGYYPVKLVELKQETLEDSLDTLTMLVIDRYNTSVLTEEDLKAIELWNCDGGLLLIGTGGDGEDTLSGFDGSYLEIQCQSIYTPEEGAHVSAIGNTEIDLSNFTLAEIRDISNQYDRRYYTGSLVRSMGMGAVGIFPYSLTELGKAGDSIYPEYINQNEFVESVMDEVSSAADARYNNPWYYSDYNNLSTMSRMLRSLGNSDNHMNFGILKLLVVLYVIFAGPILYIILCAVKKKELYWVAVPASAALGILLVFLAGRGFEVVSTKVYSVTAENLSGRGERRTYLYCFDASHREWDLKLADRYEYVGPLVNGRYVNDDKSEDAYYVHIRREGTELSFGIRPTSNFENCFFQTGGTVNEDTDRGSISYEGIGDTWLGNSGRITNNTGRDFLYYAVIANDTLCVYESLPAGESCDLSATVPVYICTQSFSQGYYVWNDYVNAFLDDLYEEKEYAKAGAVSALGVGICSAYSQNEAGTFMVIGVTTDWDEAIDDNCNEVSYGCLYTTQ